MFHICFVVGVVICFTFVLFWVLQVSCGGRGAREGTWREGSVAQWADAAGGVCVRLCDCVCDACSLFCLLGFVLTFLFDLIGFVLMFLFGLLGFVLMFLFGLLGFVLMFLFGLLGFVLMFLFVVRSCMRVQCRLFSVREMLG